VRRRSHLLRDRPFVGDLVEREREGLDHGRRLHHRRRRGATGALARRLPPSNGLLPTSKGKRVLFSGGRQAVIDGPFAETKELIAGFWRWKVKSMEDAVDWLKRSPFDGGTEVEIRQIFEPEDFGANLTPELCEQCERRRARVEERSSKR
jgi:hypothetical protein